jgi:hypothetical protein
MTKSKAGLWSLRIDVVGVKILVWIACLGRDADLTADAHLYFADRYRRLAEHHRLRGHVARAQRLDERAREHEDASGLDGPPFAAAIAMPRPTRFVSTNPVSKTSVNTPDDAA